MRVGIFGGTFDPVHQGHMIVAEQVMTELDLAQVVFVPGGIPPHKEASSVRATAPDRLAMVEAAVEGNERFSVDRVEIDAGRPMHSVETVRILRERSPDDDWFFITGADEVSNLLAWREPDRLLEQVVMVAATRPGYDLSKLDHLEAALRNFDRIFPVECTRVDISATAIRRRMLQRKSIRYLVPEGVREIIENRGPLQRRWKPNGRRASGGGDPVRRDESVAREDEIRDRRRGAHLRDGRHGGPCGERDVRKDVTLIDLRGLVSYADYFVIASAQTERQTRRVAQEVIERMIEKGHRPRTKRLDEGTAWISLDFLDVVVHIFTDEARDYYRLESLWRSAPQQHWQE